MPTSSEVIRREAQAAGLADTVVVNTCAVTAEAVRQARQTIRRLKRERSRTAHPRHRLRGADRAAHIRGHAGGRARARQRGEGQPRILARARDVLARAPFRIAAEEKIAVNDIMAVTETAAHLVDGFEGRARAFVQVQNGCDHRCTFCIIPYGRGNSRSVPMGDVVDEVRRLCAHGYREVVLTGVDLTSYGTNLPGAPKLGRLVRQILRHVPELERLRLSSIDSIEADRDLLDALADEPRLMPHLHLSLQAGDDMILKRMKRRHLRADAIAFCEQVRRAAARRRVRRRHHRRLPDRDRGDVRPLARPGRGMRPDAPACLSVLAASGHAGGAHAAGRPRNRQGAGAAGCASAARPRCAVISMHRWA